MGLVGIVARGCDRRSPPLVAKMVTATWAKRNKNWVLNTSALGQRRSIDALGSRDYTDWSAISPQSTPYPVVAQQTRYIASGGKPGQIQTTPSDRFLSTGPGRLFRPRKLLCPVNALLRLYDEARIAVRSDRRRPR